MFARHCVSFIFEYRHGKSIHVVTHIIKYKDVDSFYISLRSVCMTNYSTVFLSCQATIDRIGVPLKSYSISIRFQDSVFCNYYSKGNSSLIIVI